MNVKTIMEYFPFEVKHVTNEVPILGLKEKIIISPGKWSYIPSMKDYLPKIYNMEVRREDVWLIASPKSGNTWMSELIYTVVYNTEKAKMVKHFDRWYFPELTNIHDNQAIIRGVENCMKTCFNDTVNAPSPRLIRTHIPLALLPPNLLNTSKVIYVARNPKDVVVSYYHFNNTIIPAKIKFKEFLENSILPSGFMTQILLHLKDAYSKRNHPNLHFVWYENMKQDLTNEIRQVARFLNIVLTDEQIQDRHEHLSFKTMKANPMINMDELKEVGLVSKDDDFIRKGIVGDWKNHFTAETEAIWSKWWSSQDCDHIQFPGIKNKL